MCEGSNSFYKSQKYQSNIYIWLIRILYTQLLEISENIVLNMGHVPPLYMQEVIHFFIRKCIHNNHDDCNLEKGPDLMYLCMYL